MDRDMFMITCVQGHTGFQNGLFCLKCHETYCEQEANKECLVCSNVLTPFNCRREAILNNNIQWICFEGAPQFGLVDFTEVPVEAIKMVNEANEVLRSSKVEPIIFPHMLDAINFMNAISSGSYRTPGQSESVDKERFIKTMYDGRALLLINHEAKGEYIAPLLMGIDETLTRDRLSSDLFLRKNLIEGGLKILSSLSRDHGIDLISDSTLTHEFLNSIANRGLASGLASKIPFSIIFSLPCAHEKSPGVARVDRHVSLTSK